MLAAFRLQDSYNKIRQTDGAIVLGECAISPY